TDLCSAPDTSRSLLRSDSSNAADRNRIADETAVATRRPRQSSSRPRSQRGVAAGIYRWAPMLCSQEAAVQAADLLFAVTQARVLGLPYKRSPSRILKSARVRQDPDRTSAGMRESPLPPMPPQGSRASLRVRQPGQGPS